MESAGWVLVSLCALGGAVFALFLGYSDLVGTKAQRRRRYEEIVRSFDGRPEVKVRVSGTGLSAEQTAWLGHQYGYSVRQWKTDRHQPRYLVMHRTAPYPPANTGYGPAAWNAPPSDISTEQIRNELHRAPDPPARRNQIMALLIFGIGAVVAAVSNYRSGDSYLLPAIAAPLFFAGAVALTWYTRRANRRRQSPPAPGQQKW
ncbi:hypothetical protein AB0C96_16020 [Streptomyces sp. NPDC048506]|uniref:hypothetical protein n=1 Tax=Streptomyces sp. NPDC048506 TaxID=3155028 RepID=UPI0034376B68